MNKQFPHPSELNERNYCEAAQLPFNDCGWMDFAINKRSFVDYGNERRKNIFYGIIITQKKWGTQFQVPTQ